MRVSVDGESITLGDDATLGDALDAAGVSPPEDVIIGVVKGRGEKAKKTNSYWLSTAKGKIRIELLETGMQNVWHRCVDEIVDLEARWADSRAVAFGPLFASLTPTRQEHEYDRWEVVLGASGFEADRVQFVFVKRRHTAAYGVPDENRGVFAAIVGGKDILDELEKGDMILSVDPIVEWEDLTEKTVTKDRTLLISEGMEIYTTLRIDLVEAAPYGSEFVLAATRDDIFSIDAVTSSYISSDILLTEPIQFEHREPRSEGAVTVRTTGRGAGRIFIYKSDRTSLPSHSLVGRVTSGMDLAKLVGPGQRIAVKVNPSRVMLMGLPLKEALDIASDRKLDAVVEGHEDEDAVVVGQDPATTMKVVKEGKVKLTTVPSDRLVAIELYDDLAPRSLDYFRHVVGLKEKPVGPLPIYFVYENTVLFKPVISATSYKELMPENKPTDKVLAGEIGVTNQAAKRAGLVGVKLVDDKKYGPSGEKFTATNIIGRVIDLDKLRDVKEDETIYLLEVRS